MKCVSFFSPWIEYKKKRKTVKKNGQKRDITGPFEKKKKSIGIWADSLLSKYAYNTQSNVRTLKLS